MSRTGGLSQRHVTERLDQLADELGDTFRGVFSANTITRFVYETYSLLDRQATVKTHLITLTARFACQRLTDHGHAQGLVQVAVPQVLFICVRNVGRSQMAAALLDHQSGGRVSVRSAGSRPSGEIPAAIVESLAELGVGLTEAYPKPLTDEVVRAADVVITMGCGDTCPVYPGKRYLDWDIDDPVGLPAEGIRRVRDDLDGRITVLLSELLGR